jgi:hypothetical protein
MTPTPLSNSWAAGIVFRGSLRTAGRSPSQACALFGLLLDQVQLGKLTEVLAVGGKPTSRSEINPGSGGLPLRHEASQSLQHCLAALVNVLSCVVSLDVLPLYFKIESLLVLGDSEITTPVSVSFELYAVLLR